MKTRKRLVRDYFSQNALMVAEDLIGRTFVFGETEAIITETEAYLGQDDPASHAYRGPTPRTQVMFGPSGISYVYFIYGMYHCFNIVTELDGKAGAVLIRGLEIPDKPEVRLDGPGKICRFLGITLEHKGLDLTTSPMLYILDSKLEIPYLITPRIGISKAKERLWRFVKKK